MALRQTFAMLLIGASLMACASETPEEGQGTEEAISASKPLGPDPAGKAAKYPIVLVHGFTGSRTLWNFVGVPEALKGDGHYVFHTELHPFGTPDENAKVIKDQVEEVLRKTGAAKVNLVAHSKGGVDARAYVANYKAGDKVATLTTIASPHRGTHVADVALGFIPDGAKTDQALGAIATAWTHHFSKDDLAKGNDIRLALESMAERNADAFNRTHPDDARVDYRSWAGVSSPLGLPNDAAAGACEGKGYLDSPRDALDIKLLISALLTGHFTDNVPNDGISTVASAKWGKFMGCIPADHQDDVGRPGTVGADSRSGFDHVRFYRQLAFDLAKRGF